ncbi:hypothetical protein KJ618_02370 [Patescibacteria group bacterium]|nr:hypothetical protein [Patescibacteria group bacterium]
MIRLFKDFIIIATLFLLGTLLSLWWYKEVYITAIQEQQSETIPASFTKEPLVKGKTLHFEITAKHNNLGVLKLRPKIYNRINYDTIYFRLREKGKETWEINNSYVVDRFEDKLFYPFGFPIIPNSEGRIYEVEITSEKGTPTDSIGFYSGYNSIATQYIFPIKTIVTSNKMLTWFLLAKVISLFKDLYFIMYYVIFLIPVILYVLIKYIKNNFLFYFIEIFIFLYMLINYIFVSIAMDSSVIIYILTIGFFIFVSHLFRFFEKYFSIYRFSPSWLYSLSAILVVYLLINIAFNKVLESTRIALAIYYTTLLALALSFVELVVKQKKRT